MARSLFLDLGLAVFRIPSFLAAFWAFLSVASDLENGYIGVGSPLRIVLFVPIARAAWVVCAVTPYSSLRTRPAQRVFAAVAAISASFLIYDQTASLYYWRPELTSSLGPAQTQCIGSPPPAQSRVVLGQAPNYDIYVYQRCSVLPSDVYFGLIYLTPVLGFMAHQLAGRRLVVRNA